jgi:hypothetical protein
LGGVILFAIRAADMPGKQQFTRCDFADIKRTQLKLIEIMAIRLGRSAEYLALNEGRLTTG